MSVLVVLPIFLLQTAIQKARQAKIDQNDLNFDILGCFGWF